MNTSSYSMANAASACRHCVQVARRLESRFCLMRLNARRWDRYVEQMQKVIARLELHLKWASFATAPDVSNIVCLLADQAAPFDAVVAFEMYLLAADILYYVCGRETQCGDALQKAADTIRPMHESKAMLLIGKASDFYENSGAYRHAIAAEQLAMRWAKAGQSTFYKTENVMRLRRERIDRLSHLNRLISRQ